MKKSLLRVEEITSLESWADIKDTWEALAADCAHGCPFLTYDWFHCCLLSHGHDKEWLVLLFKDKDETIGIAPLWRYSIRVEGIPLAAIGFITVPDTSQVDFLIRDGRQKDVLEALVEYLGEHKKSDVWIFNQWPREAPTRNILRVILDAHQKRSFQQFYSSVPYRLVEQDWESFWRSRPSKFKKTRRNISNRLEKLGKIEVECCREDETGEALAAVLSISESSWKAAEGIAITTIPENIKFFQELTAVAGQNGSLMLWLLKVDGQAVAMEYDLCSDGKVYALRSDFRTEFRDSSPGAYLELQLMKFLFENRYEVYNTGPGTNPYKLQWADRLQENVAVFVCRESPRGRLLWYTRCLRSKLKPMRQSLSQLTLRGVLLWVKSRVKTAVGWILARVIMLLGGMRGLLSFTHHWAISKEPSSRFVRLSRRTNPAFLILGYHRVSDEPHPFFGGLPVRIFRRHMEHLKTYFTPLPLKELVERAASGDVPPNAIAVTFDDGYRDNYQNAFPVLVQFEMPATVFLATSAVEANKPLWHDRVFEAFRLTSANFLIWKGEALAMTNDTEVEFVLERVLGYLRTCAPAKRDEVILDLEQKLRVDLSSEDFLPKLDWNEVRRMYERNITFGAHTVSHPILSRMPLDDAVREIRLSKEVIEKQLGTSIELFAYPNGRHEDFTDQIKEALRTEGFACAVTTMHGINDASTDPFELRRLSHTDGDAKLWGLQLGLYRFVG